MSDPAVERMLRSLRAALASFDAENEGAPDRHADSCECGLCEYVRATRELATVREPKPFEGPPLHTLLPKRKP